MEGDKIRIEFDSAGQRADDREKFGLEPVKPAAADAKIKWISIAGEDKKYATGRTPSSRGNALVVSCKDVPNPIAVRYAFAQNPQGAGLYNKEGFPASPFRTDSW